MSMNSPAHKRTCLDSDDSDVGDLRDSDANEEHASRNLFGLSSVANGQSVNSNDDHSIFLKQII